MWRIPVRTGNTKTVNGDRRGSPDPAEKVNGDWRGSPDPAEKETKLSRTPRHFKTGRAGLPTPPKQQRLDLAQQEHCPCIHAYETRSGETPVDVQPFEKLGRFYLGKKYDLESREIKPEYINYDAKDLTTHAVCVGMTGSGKTGLCISLLEEAGLDGVPAIALDPKGDLSNLLLTFPHLAPEDFRPWVDEAEAVRKGETPDQYAADVAERWQQGLKEWGQDGSRIGRLRESVDMAIYTPGSNAGLPLTVLRSFAAPPEILTEDIDAFRRAHFCRNVRACSPC